MRKHTEATQQNTWPGGGLIFGAGIGTVIGIFVDQIALGAAFGASLGLVVGAVLDLLFNHRT